MKRKD